MATQVIKTTFLLRKGQSSAWASVNPTLMAVGDSKVCLIMNPSTTGYMLGYNGTSATSVSMSTIFSSFSSTGASIRAAQAETNLGYITTGAQNYINEGATPTDVTGINFNGTVDSITSIGTSKQVLTYTLTPAGASGLVTFVSSNEDIATINENGLITAISDYECYPLLIDSNGDFQTLETEDRTDNGYLLVNLIAAGYKYACTGWGRVIYNYANDSLSSQEIVHKNKYIRQIVSQFQNRDYFILSIDKTSYSGPCAPKSNEGGATYDKIADFCTSKGVRIAYSLDSGGSCETCVGDGQVNSNSIFEGTVGRAIPTVMYWSIDE